MTIPTPSLAVIDGTPRASSLDIASHFSKRHTDVMRAINAAVSQVPEDFAQRNFAFSEYQDSTGRSLPKCDLTHDGFSFVVMGFTGKEAAQWKVVYIMAFREMGEQLARQREVPTPETLPPADAPLTPDQQCTLQAIVKAKVEAIPAAERSRGIYPQIWGRFNNHFRVARYSQLPQSRMSEAVAYLMAMEVRQKALPAPPALEDDPEAWARELDEMRMEAWQKSHEFTRWLSDLDIRLSRITNPLFIATTEVLTGKARMCATDRGIQCLHAGRHNAIDGIRSNINGLVAFIHEAQWFARVLSL